jgi:hypothetical protein
MIPARRTARMFRVALTVMALLPSPAKAQINSSTMSYAECNGGQVVPPVVTSATADVSGVLNAAETSLIIVGFVNGLGSNPTGMHIHGPAAPGVNGAQVFDLAAIPSTSFSFSSTRAITPGQVAQLKAGLWYFDIHTTGAPLGEIRGQLLLKTPYVANLGGAQVVPSQPVAGTGQLKVMLNAAESKAFVKFEWSGLSGTASAHLHGPALPGANGSIAWDLFTGWPASVNSGILIPLNPVWVADLKAGRWYFDVHTTAAPGGEIRGQINPPNKATDFDADGRAEIGVYRATDGTWYLLNQGTNVMSQQSWGAPADIQAPGDFDGDGKADPAVWRPSIQTFFVRQSATGAMLAQPFGAGGDDARVPGDYDGDGKVDFAVYRSGALSFFHVLQSTTGTLRSVQFGTTGDVSVVGDFDGDGKNDVAVYRTGTGTFYVLGSQTGFFAQPWGVFSTDFLTSGDFDGDRKTDFAVFRFTGPEAGIWYILQSSTGTLRAEQFGLSGDLPAPVDFDGDGRADLAVVRTSGGLFTWYLMLSATSSLRVAQFGQNSDTWVQRYLIR